MYVLWLLCICVNVYSELWLWCHEDRMGPCVQSSIKELSDCILLVCFSPFIAVLCCADLN